MIRTPLPLLTIRGRELLPVIQGGMGVGISGHRLAGAVAKEGAIGTIASVDLRRLYPDIMQRLRKCHDPKEHSAANVEALDREIRAAREIAPDGFVAVNVMRALSNYAELVVQACKSGANAIVSGAGLPFDLPDLTEKFKNVALIPILSEERGVRAVLKKWMRKGRLPDAIVIEHPRYAGGHLGATRMEEVNDPKFDFAWVLVEIRRVFQELGLAIGGIPLIPAGGINSFQKIRELFDIGAAGAQIGTPFAVTEECDAHPNFKKVLAEAGPEDIVTFMSAAGLPARAVLTPWLKNYLAKESKLRAKASPASAQCPSQLECLAHCGFKDGNPHAGQFCIETQLAAAQRGNIQQGLFFRGSESLPFGAEIRKVHELLEVLLTGRSLTAAI
ncbi:MAG: 2-nitropropane dioxygenase [Candidatus Muproteobacteria bacterium RIFCSPHIGHO2_12_FULL_60_33]|uniref:2-nitropropane dioxygenase n=1 Tax=Candidatus Muproteobacteria bacterium RIFCSPLOWO2_01_FULL_60_18 TaxID=1817768 RepID=A0A1F6TXE0_9PROT|nr:MAG: 2-nitropropane dioxygenase [Candidatus Muproteobacteria bacterium RIFCSPLOWO2_01_FULL_60_18]OGI53216.1 MAG: 2-nitropropane dioxygenase [Candidatus Muproteobacteria bacterium RIFCSPHIGHO2_01_60_12]OGI54903.1 MAG: 2-nitropropane dioxygenase [Candidatus Muproteobacteria bacterium RIFCSPHIGHO2_02_FULL_60_13]OGI55949.1 MAG: 2-nitropropane dioxygenase [Candidatus Muproteobacteria bacterium RIFCSPHIGHO2_12_FULL_60_33]OGI59349.1 MAG: 2-nitropropane dioxygenase [Candidatus Muproteobacteria bacte